MAKTDDWLQRTRDMLHRHRDETRCAYVGLQMQTGDTTVSMQLLHAVGCAIAEACRLADQKLKARGERATTTTPIDEDSFG